MGYNTKFPISICDAFSNCIFFKIDFISSNLLNMKLLKIIKSVKIDWGTAGGMVLY